ncbi:hypothetical protein [Hyalangium versicolor]|uniref:hypothetical protein n=1 Tax=Hyalangium versicolor TaxID=2861190 RepID=UPI001CCCF444|nr:hypothetical protein [Hyalangium versicolor]
MWATLTCLALCACGGDSRRDLVGNYDVTGSFTVTYGDGQKDTQTVDSPLTIIADAFDSEKIYLDFDCGLPATMSDSGFVFTRKACDSYEVEECTYAWTYSTGGGSKEEEGTELTLNPGGTIKGLCSDGSSGQISFLFKLTGTPSGTPSGNPGEQDTRSTLSTALHRAFGRATQAHPR